MNSRQSLYSRALPSFTVLLVLWFSVILFLAHSLPSLCSSRFLFHHYIPRSSSPILMFLMRSLLPLRSSSILSYSFILMFLVHSFQPPSSSIPSTYKQNQLQQTSIYTSLEGRAEEVHLLIHIFYQTLTEVHFHLRWSLENATTRLSLLSVT